MEWCWKLLFTSEDSDGRTQLHHAVVHDCRDTVFLLVDQLVEPRRDISRKDKLGLTPQILVRKNREIREYLQAKGQPEGTSYFKKTCGPFCRMLSLWAKTNIIKQLEPFVGDSAPPFYIPRIKEPLRLLHSILCLGFCFGTEEEKQSQEVIDNGATTSRQESDPYRFSLN